jgi:hypothetical protein
MTTFEKVKLILSSGDKKVLLERKGYFICASGVLSGKPICSKEAVTREDAVNFCAVKVFDEEYINGFKISKIIPIIHKEIKGKVGIIDCPEIREVARKEAWCKDRIEMIGQDGLEIKEFENDSICHCYSVYQEDKKGHWPFPAWAVYACDEVEEKKDDEDKEMIAKLESKGYKITKI